jgi:hypothetical protein
VRASTEAVVGSIVGKRWYLARSCVPVHNEKT